MKEREEREVGEREGGESAKRKRERERERERARSERVSEREREKERRRRVSQGLCVRILSIERLCTSRKHLHTRLPFHSKVLSRGCR